MSRRGAAALAELIVCPVCQGGLEGETCTGCGRSYGLISEVPDMTPVPPPTGDVRKRWRLWEELQTNGERAYEFDPPSSLSVQDRADIKAFARFSELEGRVLDVGCGPQVLPSYAAGFGGELLGIDPLIGAQPREFGFVKGLAEYLPFPDDSFDRVLFATSIDHFLSPMRAVRDAARVLRPGGALSIWLGLVGPTPNRRDRLAEIAGMLRRGEVVIVARRAREALRRRPQKAAVQTYSGVLEFDVPRGAIDAFHFSHPDRATVEKWLAEAGLQIEAVDSEWEGSTFIRARQPQA